MVNTAALSEPSNSHLDDESLRSMRLEAASSTPAAVSGLSGKQDTERGGGGGWPPSEEFPPGANMRALD
jgi:hypothetical protein